MRIWIVVFLASGLGAQTAGIAGKRAAGDRKNGEKMYTSYGCYQCHGYLGQGGVGPRLGPKPVLFAAFTRYLRRPAGEMPPYTAKVVSDQEVADIYAFLESIPAPPAAKDLLLLK